MLGQRHASRAAQRDDEDDEIAAAHGVGQSARFLEHDLAREVEVTAAAEAVQRRLPKQMAVRHDRGLDGLLVGVEDPDVLARPAVEDELVADGSAGARPGPMTRTRSGKSGSALLPEKGPSAVRTRSCCLLF